MHPLYFRPKPKETFLPLPQVTPLNIPPSHKGVPPQSQHTCSSSTSSTFAVIGVTPVSPILTFVGVVAVSGIVIFCLLLCAVVELAAHFLLSPGDGRPRPEHAAVTEGSSPGDAVAALLTFCRRGEHWRAGGDAVGSLLKGDAVTFCWWVEDHQRDCNAFCWRGEDHWRGHNMWVYKYTHGTHQVSPSEQMQRSNRKPYQAPKGDLEVEVWGMWAYRYTQSTRQASSRKPRGDPTENPAEHPGGTRRPSGPQGLDVRHKELRSQPRTAKRERRRGNTYAVRITSPPRPPPERANVRTYVRTLGQVGAVATYMVLR